MPALTLTPPNRAQHPSALALHEYHLAVLPAREAERVGRHLATCQLCQGDLLTLGEAHRRFTREVFPETREALVGRRVRGWRWRWLLPASGVLAVAACLLFLVPARPPPDDLQAKGAPSLAIFAARADSVLSVIDGKTQLRAGDRIRFVLWPAGARYAVIASVDGAGRTTVYHPFGGSESARLPGSARVELPGSIVLDDSPGPERVFAVMSARPFPTATVVEALQKLASKGAAAVRGTASLPLAGTVGQSILFEKSP